MRENKYAQSEKMDNDIKTDDKTRRAKKRGESMRCANAEIRTQAYLIAEGKKRAALPNDTTLVFSWFSRIELNNKKFEARK